MKRDPRIHGGNIKLETELHLFGNAVSVPITVFYDYEPPQCQTFTDPGFDASVELTSVICNGSEILGMLDEKHIAFLEEECWEDSTPNDDDIWDKEEGSLDHFNRYIAGDR